MSRAALFVDAVHLPGLHGLVVELLLEGQQLVLEISHLLGHLFELLPSKPPFGTGLSFQRDQRLLRLQGP